MRCLRAGDCLSVVVGGLKTATNLTSSGGPATLSRAIRDETYLDVPSSREWGDLLSAVAVVRKSSWPNFPELGKDPSSGVPACPAFADTSHEGL